MFIIEFILKKIAQIREKPTYDPMETREEQDYESCEHSFMPVDSTGETLSCTKCGLLAKRSELKNKNFFMN